MRRFVGVLLVLGLAIPLPVLAKPASKGHAKPPAQPAPDRPWGADLPRAEAPARCRDKVLSVPGPDGAAWTAELACDCLGTEDDSADAGLAWLTRPDGQVVWSESTMCGVEGLPELSLGDADGDGVTDVVFKHHFGGAWEATWNVTAVLMKLGKEAGLTVEEGRLHATRFKYSGAARSPKEKKLRAFLRKVIEG